MPWAAAFSSMSASNCDVRPPPVVALVVLNGPTLSTGYVSMTA